MHDKTPKGSSSRRPANDFVNISFNRGGDCTVVMPSQLSEKFGYIVDSFGQNIESLQKNTHSNVCHLPRTSLKNDWIVKFVKKIYE